MPKLNELGLGNEKIGNVDFDTMPDQRGSYAPPPQPGTYRFKLPMFNAESPIFDKMPSNKGGERLNVLFEEGFALTIVQSPGGTHNGESFNFRISNSEFDRAKKGEPELLASDLDYLLRDAFKDTKRPQTNAQYAAALIKHAGKEFTADEEFTWRCDPKRDIYVEDGAGGQTKVEGTKGCGAKYYQGGTSGVPKQPVDPSDPNSPLVYPERIICSGKDGVPCGASVRAFPRLRNFRA